MASSFSASQGITVKWTLDSNDPTTSQLQNPTLSLCTGPNSNIYCFKTPLQSGFTLTAKSLVASLAELSTEGASGSYYLQFYAGLATGGHSIHYSDRFTLTGMTGSKQPSSGGDTTPPPDDVETGGNPSSLAGVPYTAQTGNTRLAPMQTQPGTTVTRPLKVTRRNPTSAVTYYSTPRMAAAQQQTTLTPSWSYTFSAATNYASARPTPTLYYAASQALKLSSFAHSGKTGAIASKTGK
ncbi:cell wall synthesis protein Kre9p [Trichomonascus vanleenenianus]|uniref:Kre9p n=1 Tax=Trichomonascus vanleenenianus TaxID=2268995 RepID=UPI003ECB6D82